MAQAGISGPIRVVHAADGVEAAVYVIPFDKRGVCTGPATRDQLLEQAEGATDVFVFSHGLNNDWKAATRAFDRFIQAYLNLRAQQWPHPDRDYKPLLAGVFWPSAALVAPWERAPDIAGGDPLAHGSDAAEVVELAGGLAAEKAGRLYELADRTTLAQGEVAEFARLISSVLNADDEVPDEGSTGRDPDDLIAAWHAASTAAPTSTRASSASGHLIDDEADAGSDDAGSDDVAPAAAGFGLSDLNPRNLIRLATVLLMKDRAGTVGANGVADLLQRLRRPSVRIHLIGHSYGAKVVLSALRVRDGAQVDSVLLLQPAVSAYCFAPAGSVPGSALAGGYEPTLTRSRQPILATFSRHDFPLRSVFQLAARRRGDLGEADVAADQAPSRYSALGGYGPLGRPITIVDAVEPPAPYRFPANPTPVIGVRASGVIANHGDVTSPATAWMLLNQVRS